jgi:hypothetical protein
MKRRFSSASYSLQKASLKLATYKPSTLLIAVIIMGISIFLLGGGVYDMYVQPPAILPTGSSFLPYIPYSINEQLLVGSIGVMILYAMGVAGLLLIYRSTKYVRNPHQVSILSKLGVVLILLAFAFIEVIIYLIMNY